MSELPAISVDHVAKSFRLTEERSGRLRDVLTGFNRSKPETFWALDDVSFDVPRGSLTSVIGHNGSGKSTLLRVLAGVYRPTRGSVVTRGRIAALLELGAGFHHELSGRENIYLNGAVMGMQRDQVDEIVDEIIAMADIGQFIDSPVEVYSSGMRARLGFAVSVHLEPEILLLDEIISVGDVQFAQQCRRRIESMVDSGITIVLVSHDLGLVQRMSDQVVWLHRGKVRDIGDPNEIITAYLDYFTGATEIEDEFGGNRGRYRIRSITLDSPGGLDVADTGCDLRFHVRHDGIPDASLIRVRFRHHHGDMPIQAAIPVPCGALDPPGELSLEIPRLLPIPPGRYAIEVAVLDAAGEELALARSPLPVRAPEGDPGETVQQAFADDERLHIPVAIVGMRERL